MVRYDPYTDSFIDNPTKETTAAVRLEAFPKSIIQLVEVSDESIEKIADAVVRKLADRKTESKLCRECEEYAGDGMYCASNHLVYDFDTCKDEPNSSEITNNLERSSE